MNGHMGQHRFKDAVVWFRELAANEVNQELKAHFERIANLIVPGSTIYEYQERTYEATVRELLGSATDVHSKVTACVQIATLTSIAVSI